MAYHTTTRKLIDAYHAAKRGESISTGMWNRPTFSPDEFLCWFHNCLASKINRDDKRTGRKFTDEYETEIARLQRYIGNRIVIDWVAPVFGPRVRLALAGRLRSERHEYWETKIMLTIHRFREIATGQLCAGFTVRNARGKAVAIGAMGHFVQATHDRYQRDRDRMAKIGRMVGMQPRNT